MLSNILSPRGLFLMALPLLVSCKGLNFNEEESYGLKLVSLDITPEEYGLLNGQLFSKRPAQVEIRVAGEFKVYCSASYAGRSSLDAFRKSYDLNFCDEKYKKRSSYRLSAQAIDKTMVRSLIGYEVFKELGLEVPHIEFASAYINRKYLGVYVFMEVVDKEFYKAHKMSVQEIYKARYGNSNFKTDWASRLSEAFSYDGKGEDNFVYLQEIYKLLYNEPSDVFFSEKLEKFFDVESFLSYAASALILNHWDGFDNNYFLTYDTDKKKLITTPWDLDRIWEKPEEPIEDLLTKNALLDRLLKIEKYRVSFVGKVAKLNTSFTPDKLVGEVQKHEATIREAYEEDPILHRYQTTAFVELEANIRAWDLKIKDYLSRNPVQ